MSTTNAEVEASPRASEWDEVQQTIMRTALDGFWVVDAQGRFLEVSQVYCEMVGYQRDELLGMSIHCVEALESQADVERHMQRIIAKGSERFETRHRRQDGRTVDIEASVRYVPAKGHVLGFLRNITERKRAEGRTAWLASFPEQNPNPVVELELPSGMVSYANAAARDLLLDLADQRLAHCWLAGLEQAADELIQSDKLQAIRDVMVGDRCYAQVIHYLPEQRRLRVYGTDISAHKRAENALRRSEAKFRALFDSTSDAVMLLDDKGFIDCNQAALAMFGCATREQFCSCHPGGMSPLQQPCGTDSFTLANQHIARAMEQGSDQFEWVHKRLDTGQTFPAEVLLNAMELDGKPVLQAVVRNITARKRAEEALRKSEEELRALFDDAPLPYHEIDRNGIVLRVNRAECEMLGVEASELVGRPIWDFVSPEEREVSRASVAGILLERGVPAPYERRFRSRSGAELILQIHRRPILDPAGNVVRIRAAMIDLTKTKQLDARLTQERQLLRALMDSATDHIYFKDAEGRFMLVNAALARAMGYSDPSQVVGKTDFDFFSPEHAEAAYLDEQNLVHETVPIVSREEKETWRDGRETWVHTTKLPLHDPSGRIAGTFGISHDITERRRMEQDLHASEDRLKLAQEALGLGTWEVDVATNQPKNSEKMPRLYGRSGANMDRGEWLNSIHPDDRAGVVTAFNDSLESGETLNRQFRVVWPDGSVHWLHSISRVIRGAGSKPVRVVGVDFDVTEHARAEERLRILSTAVEQSSVSIMITDLDGNIEYANPRTTESTGYTFEELKGKNCRILKSGETPPEEYRRLWETIQTGEWRGVFHNRKKSGELFWEAATIGPVRDALGKVTHFLAVKEDITARKQAEVALAAEAVRRRILFEQSKDGVVVFDRNCKVCEANPSFANMLGYSMEEMRLLHVWDWDAQLTKDQIKALMKGVQSAPATFETRFKRKDGTVLDAEVSSSAAELDGQVFYYAVSRDISERKAVETALYESEERFRLITETLSEVFWVADAGLAKIFYVSPAYERVYGRSRESLYEDPRSFIEAIHPDDRNGALAQFQMAKIGQTSNHEYRILQPDGSVRWIWDRGFPICDGSDPVSRYVGIAVDITERKELERQLTQAQKLESIGQLAAGIAHEINTPIQYIGDNGKFLEDAFQDLLKVIQPQETPAGAAPGLPDSASPGTQEVDVEYLREEIPKAIGQLLEGVGQVARIVRAMKEFSHPGPAEKMPLDINRAIASTILVSKNEWKYVAELTTDLDPELPPVPCLAGEFNQVMLNLIVNSAQAIGGVVKQSGKKGAIRIRTRREDDWAEIRISDTGGGIPEAIRSRVFDPFFTTKEVGKGTGQGLAIAYAVVVQKHQGTITFESETGVGATFVIRLPLKTSRENCEANSLCG